MYTSNINDVYAHITDTFIGLTSLLDSLLDSTSQAKPSECSTIPAKEIDASIDTQAQLQVSDQSPQRLLKTTTKAKLPECSHICAKQTEGIIAESSEPTLGLPHDKSSKDNYTQISVSTQQSRSVDKSTSTAPHDSETSSRELNQSEVRTLFHDIISTKDDPKHDPMTSTFVDTSIEPAYKTMIHCHDKLVTALSTDILSMSGILLAKEFISEEVHSKMCLTTLTREEKATDLVIAIRKKIKLVPNRFKELIKIFSEQTCTKDIVPSLSSCDSCETIAKDRNKDIGVIISTNQRRAVCGGHMYTAWASLDPDDKIDLEARLLNEAETIGQDFALLCCKARDSLIERGITPQDLAYVLLDLMVYKPSTNSSIPMLKEKEETLMKAQSVHETFNALRPHMSFFNYEILQFLIEGKGSDGDKVALDTYLRHFMEFCKRHVFEVPFTKYSNGHQAECHKMKQRLHVKVTEHFKAAFLIKNTTDSAPSSTSGESQTKNVCSSNLGINLEDAKNIQRKLAKILNLNPSSLFLDTISEGSIILTFLLPVCVSLTGLDHNPEIAFLSSNGILILCGPPGVPEPQGLTPNGIIMGWSPPEYGCDSLARYILYYQKKCEHEISKWQNVELTSLETNACVHNLDDGDAYIVKICTVSDVGTLQYSNESDPIVWSDMRFLTLNAHKVISRCSEMLTLILSSNNFIINEVTSSSLTEGIISKQVCKQISLASTPNEKATILVEALRVNMQLAPEKFEKVVQILSNHSLMYTMNIVDTLWSEFGGSVCYQYTQYLRRLYARLHSKDQSPSDQWPPSATKKFFRLAMIQTAIVQRGKVEDQFVRMTITGKVDDILQHKYPIKLENIFKETRGQRKVILLEGAPGCGKSTLSVYICQQWEKGQLFNQFKLVILIRLRDPAVQNAKGLADLLPCSNAKTAQLLAGIMMEMKCQDVLFILDGWDELSSNLRKKSVFCDLVSSCLPSSNPLSRSTVIVTSRPIASGDLHQVVSSRVEILGFTVEELHQFFTECLKGDTEAVKTLLERIDENPEVAGSCYLPLNATILVHLFKSDRNTLPTTLYGIFTSLVLNCIKRHLKLRTQYKNASTESLDQLPEFAKKPFSILCRLACDGVMEDKIIFTSLPADVNTLSLLPGVESFIGREKAVSHNFIHLSIQELLAAYYIATQLPASEQVSTFNELFDKSRFSAVFRFYAAITKLRTPGIKDLVIRITRSNKKSLLSFVLHCLYEAQDPSLCESVAQQLQHGLNLGGTTLTPSDCLCIGYFLAHVCKMAAGEFKVILDSSSIGDQGCKYLVSGLHKYLDTHSAVTTLLSMTMDRNAISHHGVHHLSMLLQIGCINVLILFDNDLVSNQDAIHGTLAKQLKNSTTLKQLWLQRCSLNSQSAESLAEALTTNKYLELLDISDNALCDDGIQHLAHALRVNQGLKDLYLWRCGMTDVGFECLAESLQHNNVLTKLDIGNGYSANNPNRLTENIVPVLNECLQNNHTLTELVLPKSLVSSTASIEKAVNDVRKRSGLPLIKVMGMLRRVCSYMFP